MEQPQAPLELFRALGRIRARLELAFSPETRSPAHSKSETPSAGQCAAAALVVQQLIGGKVVSAQVQGESHWFNRIEYEGRCWDADLTGDQFGFPRVQLSAAGSLYPDGRVRDHSHVAPETLDRVRRLKSRAGLDASRSTGERFLTMSDRQCHNEYREAAQAK